MCAGVNLKGVEMVQIGIDDATQQANAQARTRVMVVDDHAVVQGGVVFALQHYPDIEVVGVASSGEEALRTLETLDSLPDVILMDMKMPGRLDGVATTAAVRAALPDVQILALSSYSDGTLVEDALRAGAVGYLLKDVTPEEMVNAIRLARQGTSSLSPAAALSLARNSVPSPQLGQDLTPREREVLALMAEGQSNQEIAERLVVTPATVKFHCRGIKEKLGTASRTETVVLALQHHLVSAPES
jgi:two-component system, NarL family, response regulator LiaR